MRRINDLITYVPALLLAIALASTVGDWDALVESGGWFAPLGHFFMVAATLVLLYIAGVLALGLAALPLILLFARNEDDFFALAEASRAGHSLSALLAVLRKIMVRSILALVNPLWKATWWCWWYLRGRALAETGRGDG